MSNSKKKFYVVLKGRNPGIYSTWFGAGGAHEQVFSFPGAVYKGFATLQEAQAWASGNAVAKSRTTGRHPGSSLAERLASEEGGDRGISADEIVLYTDGGCLNNPGPGGFGIVIIDGEKRRELSGGFRLTTNNRMELMGSIVALKSLGKGIEKPVSLYTDSRYVVDGITKGWARRWKKNGWMRDAKNRAVNIDLWAELLDLYDQYKPSFHWVKGHAGNTENERCDVLARNAALRPGLPADLAYEKGETAINDPSLF